MINQFLPCNMPLDLASLVTPWDNLVVDNPFFYIPLSKCPTEKLMFIINETSSRLYFLSNIKKYECFKVSEKSYLTSANCTFAESPWRNVRMPCCSSRMFSFVSFVFTIRIHLRIRTGWTALARKSYRTGTICGRTQNGLALYPPSKFRL